MVESRGLCTSEPPCGLALRNELVAICPEAKAQGWMDAVKLERFE